MSPTRCQASSNEVRDPPAPPPQRPILFLTERGGESPPPRDRRPTAVFLWLSWVRSPCPPRRLRGGRGQQGEGSGPPGAPQASFSPGSLRVWPVATEWQLPGAKQAARLLAHLLFCEGGGGCWVISREFGKARLLLETFFRKVVKKLSWGLRYFCPRTRRKMGTDLKEYLREGEK